MESLFSLDLLSNALGVYSLPDDKHFSTNSYKFCYGIYTLTGRGERTGGVCLEKSKSDSGLCSMRFDYRKDAVGGYKMAAGANIEFKEDAINTPLCWQYSSATIQPSGEPLKSTKLEYKAQIKGSKLIISGGKKMRSLELPDNYAINWLLFDAVQKLPVENFKPLKLTLLDHFDQFKRDNELYWRGEVEAPFLEAGFKLFGYNHTGRGLVPHVYWKDKFNRLLFVSSGIEAYVLESVGDNGWLQY